MTTRPNYKSILGRFLGVGKHGQMVTNTDGVNIRNLTDAVAYADITIGAEITNARAISIQLKNHHGENIDYAATFEIVMFSSAAMTDFVATGGTTGVAAGASGKLQAIVAKKLFRAISTVAGLWAGTYTDTGTDPGYLAVRLPNGTIVPGGLVTNT